MESRLPKPKIVLKKAISTLNVGTKLRGNGAMEGLKKSKSIHNVASQLSEELATPRRPFLKRDKTHAIITKSTTTDKAVIKRLETGSKSCEDIRRNVKAVTKTTALSKVFKNRSATAPSKSNSSTTSKAVSVPKPKLDFKGRLSEESDSSKERLKSIIQKISELQTQIDSLKEKEEASRVKMETFEVTCEELTLEVSVLQNKNTSLQSTSDDLSKERNKFEEDLTVAKTRLKIYQENCETQEIELCKRAKKLDVLEVENKSQRNTIEELNRLNSLSDLRNTVHAMNKDERQVCNNTKQESKENIRVICCVRPKIEKQISKGLSSIAFLDKRATEVDRSEVIDASTFGERTLDTWQVFSFDREFPPNTSQTVIFEELSLLVQSELKEYNVCVFGYGQTRSDKKCIISLGCTGDDSGEMIPRTVKHIFKEKGQYEILGWEYRTKASVREIDNEQQNKIQMTDSNGTDVYVKSLHMGEVDSLENRENCLKISKRNSAVAAIQSNERSLGSYSVSRIGSLDLTGFEKLRNEMVARTTETENINELLVYLGNVILSFVKKFFFKINSSSKIIGQREL